MKDTMDRVLDKLDRIEGSVSNIDITLAKQEEQLALHMRRTQALENIVEPLHKSYLMTKGAITLVGIIGAGVGFIAAVAEIIFYIKTGTL